MEHSSRTTRGRRTIWLTLARAAVATVRGLLFYPWHRSRWALRGLLRAHAREPHPPPSPGLEAIYGLSEAAAAARHASASDPERQRAARQARGAIWRDSIVSTYNLDLVGLSLVLWVLGSPLNAILTFLVLCINTALNVAQQLLALRQVERLSDRVRPSASAIRDGQVRSIDLDDVVVGDVLTVGPGDQFLADGRLLRASDLSVHNTAYASEATSIRATEGDTVSAGSYCVQGWGAYEVLALPPTQANTGHIRTAAAERTPLRQTIEHVLRGMYVLVVVFLALLILDGIGWGGVLPEPILVAYRDWVGFIFALAPGGLFLAITVAYAVGAWDLARVGALVRDSQVVESLAQLTSLCFGKTGALVGAAVEIEMDPQPLDRAGLDERRIRQLLGTWVRSTRANDAYLQAMGRDLGGERRAVEQEAPYLSFYGWSGITFSEPDVRGTYVLAEPEALRAHLTALPEPEQEQEAAEIISVWYKAWYAVRDWFELFVELDGPRDAPPTAHVPELDRARPPDPGSEAGSRAPGFWRGLDTPVRRLFSPREQEGTEEAVSTPHASLLFAYSPQPQPLYAADGRPTLPPDLTPLCTLTFSERVRPEAKEAIDAFTEAGVQVKLLTADDPEAALDAMQQLGAPDQVRGPPRIVTSAELDSMDEKRLTQAVHEATILAQVTPEGKASLIRALRAQGACVAMVGDGIRDVPAMREANVSIAFHSSSQAALGIADIVLLDDSLQTLPKVLTHGERTVNSLVDTLKLNLTQMTYLLLLVVAGAIIGKQDFFYHAAHGGVIAFFTVVVPSLALAFWAAGVVVPPVWLRPRLVHFVLPAALTTALAALVLDHCLLSAGVEVLDAQNAVALALVAMGLMLLVYVQPPIWALVGGDVYRGDWRSTWLAIGLLIAYLITSTIPSAQELFRVQPLSDLRIYAAVALTVFLWSVALRAIWRLLPLERYAGIDTDGRRQAADRRPTEDGGPMTKDC